MQRYPARVIILTAETILQMENASYIALSRQLALQQRMSTTANNIANLNTNGYKAEHMMFEDVLKDTRPDVNQIISGPLHMVGNIATFRDFEAGSFRPTSNPFDFAISGKGFFSIETPEGVRYTRDGNFGINEKRELVTANGNRVLASGGTITIPDGVSHVSASDDGTLSTKENGTIGQLSLVTFDNQQNLIATGDNLYKSEETGTPVKNAVIRQGYLETSNVRGVVEITDMIEIHRQYQSTAKLMQSEHDRQKSMLQRLSKA